MTKAEAIEWVETRDEQDHESIDDDDLEAAYAALYGRPAEDQDREEGLWSHCCAAARVED